MSTYRIDVSLPATKAIERLALSIQRRIIARLQLLATDPHPSGSVKLQGVGIESQYRVRVGDYRIIYAVRDDVLVVIIIDVGHRREVYRRK